MLARVDGVLHKFSSGLFLGTSRLAVRVMAVDVRLGTYERIAKVTRHGFRQSIASLYLRCTLYGS